MAAFLAMGLLSISRTIAILRWRKAAEAEASYAVPADDIRAARRFVHAEAAALALIPLFAAFIPRIYAV